MATTRTGELAVEFVNIRQSFMHMVQATALLTTLFAGIQAQLLSGIPTEVSPTAPQTLINALHLFSYGGLAINIGASLSAMVFIIVVRESSPTTHTEDLGNIIQNGIDAKAGLPTTEITTAAPGAEGTDDAADTIIKTCLALQSLASSITSAIAWTTCITFSICGIFCIILQIALLAWINAAPHGSTAIFVLVILGLAAAASSVTTYIMYKSLILFTFLAIWARRRQIARQRSSQSNRSLSLEE